jgi:hypothetical protein
MIVQQLLRMIKNSFPNESALESMGEVYLINELIKEKDGYQQPIEQLVEDLTGELIDPNFILSDELEIMNTMIKERAANFRQLHDLNLELQTKLDSANSGLYTRNLLIKELRSTRRELRTQNILLTSENGSYLALLKWLPDCDEPMHFLTHWMEGSWEICHQWDDDIMEHCPLLFDDIFQGEDTQ